MRKDWTFLTFVNSSYYIPGLIGLWNSLVKSHKDEHINFAVMTTDEEEGLSEKIKKIFIGIDTFRLIKCEPLPAPKCKQAMDYWSACITTLKIFGLTEYSKIVYLDADMMVLDDIFDLFSKPHMSGVASSSVIHPDCNDVIFGPLVIEPSKETEERLIEIYLNMDITLADQEVIRICYPHWKEETKLHLPILYGVYYWHLPRLITNYNYIKEDFKIIHFTGKEKPWSFKLRKILSIIKTYLIGKKHFFWCLWVLFHYRKICKKIVKK